MTNQKLIALAAMMGAALSFASPGASAQANGAGSGAMAPAPSSSAAPIAPAAPPALPTSPAKKALVQKFLTVQQAGIEALARSLAEQPLAEMRQPVLQAIEQRVPADQRDTTLKAIDGDFRKYLDESVPIIRERAVALAPSTLGAALEARLTEDELKQLITFFESSANKKYSAVAPEAQNALVQKLITDTRPAIEPKIRAVQQSVTQRITAFSAPAAATSGAPAPAAPASGAAR